MIPYHQSVGEKSSEASEEPRIGVLVLGCLLTVYQRCAEVIRATWGSKPVRNVDTFYVYGAQRASTDQEIVDIDRLIPGRRPDLQDGEVWVSGDTILCGASDIREGQRDCILRKRLMAFGYLANQRAYDFVYTVCASSYVDVAELKRYVTALPSTGVYHGDLHVHGATGYPFVSGASLLLSRDLAGDLADNAAAILSTYPDDLPDDVAIGHFIASKHCTEPVAEIAGRIADSRKATTNQAFVMPHGRGSVDFVTAPEYSQVPRDRSYHFHFNSRRMWEMENFHRRFFSGSGRDG